MGFDHQINPQENLGSVSDGKSDHKAVIVDIFLYLSLLFMEVETQRLCFWLRSLRTIVLGHYFKPQHASAVGNVNRTNKRGTGQTPG